MSAFKKFWIIFLSFLPFVGAGAAMPLVIGGVIGVGALAGFSIYRSFAPVDMAGALSFFSSCWSCQLFSDIMATMSSVLPRAYEAIGAVLIPVSVALTAVWFGWNLLAGYIGVGNKKWHAEPWTLAGNFGTHILKLGFVTALLAFPLPRLINDIITEPVFNVGMTLNHAVTPDDKFASCLVATAVADPVSLNKDAASAGAFSPKLRHSLSCELANVHQMTALGMTAGWTMLNMSFSADYMHKVLTAPVFPNVPLFLVGLLILTLFFFALLPVPLYFLEVFIKLAMDLIMLPLWLLSWLFGDWKVLGNGTTALKTTLDRTIQNIAGIALFSVFVTFAVMFLNSMFGRIGGGESLRLAFEQNDPTILMDGLLMNNDSLVMIILLGLFTAFFMNSISALIKALFSGVSIPENFYKQVSGDVKKLYENVKKWGQGVYKKISA